MEIELKAFSLNYFNLTRPWGYTAKEKLSLPAKPNFSKPKCSTALYQYQYTLQSIKRKMKQSIWRLVCVIGNGVVQLYTYALPSSFSYSSSMFLIIIIIISLPLVFFAERRVALTGCGTIYLTPLFHERKLCKNSILID